tara:strand:+ start:193 stop:420 length:228 start_codon:yes stop_codon:yes gene_type:complete
MRKIQRTHLLNLAAFIKAASTIGDMDTDTILAHVAHDIDGFVNKADDEHWMPRTAGWTRIYGKLKADGIIATEEA